MIQCFPKIASILLFLQLGRANVFEYRRVCHDLVQKGGIREDRVVYFCELLLVAQLFDKSLVFARELENIFATAIIEDYLASTKVKYDWMGDEDTRAYHVRRILLNCRNDILKMYLLLFGLLLAVSCS